MYLWAQILFLTLSGKCSPVATSADRSRGRLVCVCWNPCCATSLFPVPVPAPLPSSSGWFCEGQTAEALVAWSSLLLMSASSSPLLSAVGCSPLLAGHPADPSPLVELLASWGMRMGTSCWRPVSSAFGWHGVWNMAKHCIIVPISNELQGLIIAICINIIGK